MSPLSSELQKQTQRVEQNTQAFWSRKKETKDKIARELQAQNGKAAKFHFFFVTGRVARAVLF